MTLRAPPTDVWRLATDRQKLETLAALGSLPTRARENEADVILDQQAYMIAMEGCTRHGLSEAIRAILQGKLGHGFFPSPPELRIQHDKAMAWHERHRETTHRRERESEQRSAHRPPLTDDAIARQSQRMEEFRARWAEGEARLRAEELQRAAMRLSQRR